MSEKGKDMAKPMKYYRDVERIVCIARDRKTKDGKSYTAFVGKSLSGKMVTAYTDAHSVTVTITEVSNKPFEP